VTQLVIAGCVTDQCVEHAVRDACDLGYLVTLVPDACATHSLERHERSVAAVAGYCRRRSTEQVVAEMAAIATSRGGVDAIGNR
jgi:ureidoacrylate peracid hydrolase